MDSKQQPQQPQSMAPIPMPISRRRNRPPFLPLLLALATLYCVYHLQALTPTAWTPNTTTRPQPTSAKVPLEAHIMSKCPDARDCLRELVLPAMQRTHDKVDFTLSFIGRPTDNDGVDCKHGPEECLGNIIELCAQELYPDPKTFLGFTMCLTKQYKLIPQRTLVEDCALEHALDFEELNKCATKDDGAFGVGMLRHSVQRTADAGVTKSCTIRLDNEIYCVRDDGEWKDCPSGGSVNDLVVTIEKLYRSRSA